MLGNQNAAVCDQLCRCLVLQIQIRPAVRILDFHRRVRAYAADTEEERCEAGNDFRVRISAYIADLELVLGYLALIQHLVQLKACDNAGYITGFIYSREVIVEIGKARGLRVRAGRMTELYIREILRSLQHERTMSEAVRKDNLAAVIHKIGGSVIAGLIFSDIGLRDDLIVRESEGLLHLLDTCHMRGGIPFILIADINDADLEIFLLNALSRSRLSGCRRSLRSCCCSLCRSACLRLGSLRSAVCAAASRKCRG